MKTLKKTKPSNKQLVAMVTAVITPLSTLNAGCFPHFLEGKKTDGFLHTA
jgi:hypothetical protein